MWQTSVTVIEKKLVKEEEKKAYASDEVLKAMALALRHLEDTL